MVDQMNHDIEQGKNHIEKGNYVESCQLNQQKLLTEPN